MSNKPQQLVLKLKGPSSVSFCLYIQNPATNIQRFNGVGPARKTVKSDLKGVVKYIYWFRCGCVASRALKSLLYYLDVPRDKVIDKVTTRHVGSDINWSDFYCSEGTIVHTVAEPNIMYREFRSLLSSQFARNKLH